MSQNNVESKEEIGAETKEKWWSKMIDHKEAKYQSLFSLPIILITVSYYAIPLVSVMFAGHLGELELAAATLAQSWATVTGQSLMVGLSGALETLCGQGYGAKQYRMLGIYLQANCIISLFFSFIVSIIWFFSEQILNVLLHQDPEISRLAGVYLKFLIPVIFAYSLLHNILRFLQMQSIILPLIVCSIVPLAIHIGVAYTLVHFTSLGIKGAPIAVCISMYISVAMLGIYILHAKRFEHTWKGFTFESFHHIVSNMKLALPSAGMMCLEYWAFEILVILAGLMPNSKIATPVIAMSVNTEAIAFMGAYALSAAASTRVSNELGGGDSTKAKHAMVVTLKLTILLAILVDLALGFGHPTWAGLFTKSSAVKEKFGSIIPVLLVSIALDYFQGVLSGVARGVGWQSWVVWINLATYYLVGMPIACLLGFKLKLHEKGLWIGMTCGLACQGVGLLFLTFLTKWTRADFTSEHKDDVKEVEVQQPRQIKSILRSPLP
ncbi:hypothetical protein Leryth_007052 [Lithospermum erythrorhizon]|nr:hypothetical protein Leryth_007052 [Lithospermum erythrorhizon]